MNTDLKRAILTIALIAAFADGAKDERERELLATLWVGLTSQYLEQFGRKLLGGLLGKATGKMVGQLGQAATGVAFSFATTYALGQVARRYFAGGRQMNSALLRESFQNLLEPAKQLQAQ